MDIKEGRTLSCDGKNQLYYKIYVPEGERKGVLQVVHGMVEYIGRYDAFMREAAERGYLCFGHDHVGHGNTAPNAEELGFVAHRGGDHVLVEDVQTVADAVCREYPFEKRVLLGHSMGSFVARLYAAEHPEGLAACIFMGTGGGNPAAGAGKTLAGTIRAFRGERHRSQFLNRMMFGSYNKKTENLTGRDWLTKEIDVQRAYDADPFCTYLFTVSATQDLLNLLTGCNAQSWYEKLDRNLPVYLVSGAEDPVGGYGKGPQEIRDRLIETGHTDVTLRLWEGDRHEVLNETDRDAVKRELFDWIAAKI